MPQEQRGLYGKYVVTKADGSPTDPDAEYLVLRLDAGEHVAACRRAALTFSSWVRDANPQLADDIAAWVEKMDAEHPKPPST